MWRTASRPLMQRYVYCCFSLTLMFRSKTGWFFYIMCVCVQAKCHEWNVLPVLLFLFFSQGHWGALEVETECQVEELKHFFILLKLLSLFFLPKILVFLTHNFMFVCPHTLQFLCQIRAIPWIDFTQNMTFFILCNLPSPHPCGVVMSIECGLHLAALLLKWLSEQKISTF